MSIFVEMTRTEKKSIVDLLKDKKGYHQSEVALYGMQLKIWDSKRISVCSDERKGEYRKKLNHHEECVLNIDSLIAKLHAH